VPRTAPQSASSLRPETTTLASLFASLDVPAVAPPEAELLESHGSFRDLTGAFFEAHWWADELSLVLGVEADFASGVAMRAAHAAGLVARCAYPSPALEAIAHSRQEGPGAWPSQCCQRWVRARSDAWIARVAWEAQAYADETLEAALKLANLIDRANRRCTYATHAEGRPSESVWWDVEDALVSLAQRRETLACVAWTLGCVSLVVARLESPSTTGSPLVAPSDAALAIRLGEIDAFVASQILQAAPGLDAYDADGQIHRSIDVGWCWWALDGIVVTDDDVFADDD